MSQISLRRQLVRLASCGLLAGLVVAGCGSGGDDSADGDRATTSSAPSTSATTHPAASDESAAFPLVEDLELEAAAIADELYQDPEKITDPDDPDVARLHELYTDDSPTPEGVTANVEQLADDGLKVQAADSGIFRDLGVYQMVAIDDDTIRFRICATEDQETVDEDGTIVERRAQVTQGTGEARRVEGIWRIYGVHPEDDRTLEIAPGSATAGFCDQLFAGQDVP